MGSVDMCPSTTDDPYQLLALELWRIRLFYEEHTKFVKLAKPEGLRGFNSRAYFPNTKVMKDFGSSQMDLFQLSSKERNSSLLRTKSRYLS
jgi:hypothetical protein